MAKQKPRTSQETPVLTLHHVKHFLSKLLMDPTYFWYLAGVLLIGEVFFNMLIIQKVPYTEIDWKAYMQEVEGFIHGERDYKALRGDTGPLVYPAGFVYIYSGLYILTDGGNNVRLAQYLFEGLYIVTQWVVFAIYAHSRKVVFEV
ncbi:Lethal(2)neighbour of tid protein [Apophysomyces ossiformis]|uniref:Dol-P-Man:Man(5)GlcNAc(2)-PP-Dol alpha-1,3-mannosyltransferase n=1 Tax=Apophysomyces ossiformis TaxID=679940 RepID=A0A8H7EMJ0_9FUNG|nr:Lethal(2)neighbour of tid protein [Apophysomyces ossiformis]